MDNLKKQIEILITKGEEFRKNTFLFMLSGPADFDIWVQRVNQTVEKYFSTKSAQNSLLRKGMEIYRPLDGNGFSTTDLDRLIDILIKTLVLCLESIENDIYDEVILKAATVTNNKSNIESNKVFIVHGHDEAMKNAVARFIENVGLKPVILHEQSNKGLTIIEKFEEYSDVNFAIILLTPDDYGALKGREKLSPRARQNVIFELGFFIGKLKRQNVCALYSANIELPSDYSGILYIKIDEHDGWKLKLAKELRTFGFNISLDNLVND